MQGNYTEGIADCISNRGTLDFLWADDSYCSTVVA